MGTVTSYIRKFALVLILIRAGLEMDPAAFRKVYVTILKLGLVPWAVEFGLCAVLAHQFFEMSWIWAFALGAIIAAVSPAVIVPCLFRLRTKGYGVNKGMPADAHTYYTQSHLPKAQGSYAFYYIQIVLFICCCTHIRN